MSIDGQVSDLIRVFQAAILAFSAGNGEEAEKVLEVVNGEIGSDSDDKVGTFGLLCRMMARRDFGKCL